SEVVNQIAAGEVVERPSHLVKELIENSIDAGALEIEISFSEGGKKVRVKDNGSGIDKSDLALALDRHATSKISTTDDIWKLSSLGFRGEALASISSVSLLTITSKTPSSNSAYQISCEFGKISEVFEVGGDFGTIIEISDLFSNQPARLKFLKSESAESTQIKNTIKALAMSNPHVAFKVFCNNVLTFFWPVDKSLIDRVQNVLDREDLFSHKFEYEGVKAEIVLCGPNKVARSSRSLWFFVQGRSVQDKGLRAAVMDAYRNLLMHGEFPVGAIFLTCQPDFVDVNIHPTKSEVKFLNATYAFKAVNRACREMLLSTPWIKEDLSANNFSAPAVEKEKQLFESFQKPQVKNENAIYKAAETNYSFSSPEFSKSQYNKKSFVREASDFTRTPGMEALKEAGNRSDVESGSSSAANEPQGKWGDLQIVGQADLTYILAQSNDALFLIDQHAAHERVAFEGLMQAWKDGKMEIQNRLLPLDIIMDEDKVQAIMDNSSHLEKLGLYVEQISEKCIGVVGAPTIVKPQAIHLSIEKYAEEIIENGGSFSVEKKVGDVFATMACHSVIRAGQALSVEQMQSLLLQLDEYSLSSFCPHGRPVYIKYSFGQIEKEFGRIL
ncbi:DNA mismatch repair endonuclease MutL, partial [bacterium]|nr:DNA mismatch repair endonuclease MutL [bacterium]